MSPRRRAALLSSTSRVRGASGTRWRNTSSTARSHSWRDLADPALLVAGFKMDALTSLSKRVAGRIRDPRPSAADPSGDLRRRVAGRGAGDLRADLVPRDGARRWFPGERHVRDRDRGRAAVPGRRRAGVRHWCRAHRRRGRTRAWRRHERRPRAACRRGGVEHGPAPHLRAVARRRAAPAHDGRVSTSSSRRRRRSSLRRCGEDVPRAAAPHDRLLRRLRARPARRSSPIGVRSDPSFYVCAPSVTDPELAPPGTTAFYPAGTRAVPRGRRRLGCARAPRTPDRLLERAERGPAGLREAITYRSWYTPADFARDYHRHRGSIFGLVGARRSDRVPTSRAACATCRVSTSSAARSRAAACRWWFSAALVARPDAARPRGRTMAA